MNALIKAIEALVEARRIKDEKKATWTTLMGQGSSEQGAAKALFLQADEVYSQRAQDLGKALTDLREIFCLEMAIDALSGELQSALRRSIVELRYDHFLAPVRLYGLEALAHAWRNAGAMLDAAKALFQHCQREGTELEFEAFRKEAESYRNPAAWLKVVNVCEIGFAAMRHGAEERQERIGEAVTATVRFLQKKYDESVGQLQTELEGLHEAESLGAALNDLEDRELCRALQAALGGLIRQRQTQTETQRQTRPVTTIECETETETEPDEGTADGDGF